MSAPLEPAMSPPPIEHLRVATAGPVDPGLLATAIRSRLVGDPWPAGPERAVADAVVAAVGEALAHQHDPRRSPWR